MKTAAKNHYLLFALIFAFLSAVYFLSGMDHLFLSFHLLLLLSASFLFSFVASKWLAILLVVAIPLSVQMDSGISGTTIFFPSELLTGIFAGAFIIKQMKGEIQGKAFFFHPVTRMIGAYFLLILVTGIFTAMPLVSLKAMIVKALYFVVFYFLVFDAFKSGRLKSSLFFIFCYTFALLPIVIISFSRFSDWGYAKDAADLAAFPFYKDHTIYSACVAFLIPALAYKTFSAIPAKRPGQFILNVIVLLLLSAALFYSFSRAAWISVLAAFIFLIVLIIKIRPFALLMISAVFSILLYQHSDRFLTSLKKNKSDSNMRNADVETQTKSILNISTDQSNAERLNRWKCALRMFVEKPFTGFGSGTYMFQYFPYQRSADMTPISVTSPYNVEQGHGGSVHSEYLMVLSENGIFTCIVFIILVIKIILTGMKNAYDHPVKIKRMEAAALTLSLITYLVHGLFNNYLDTDKAAFLFWSSVCMIVMIDLSRYEIKN